MDFLCGDQLADRLAIHPQLGAHCPGAIVLRMCNINTYVRSSSKIIFLCMYVCMSLLLSYAGNVLPLRLHIQSPTDSQAR